MSKQIIIRMDNSTLLSKTNWKEMLFNFQDLITFDRSCVRPIRTTTQRNVILFLTERLNRKWK
jgi:hypothetical protein